MTDTSCSEFFQTHRAVYISSQQQWVTSKDSIWYSKVSLKHLCTLSAEYPHALEGFFKQRLQVQDAHAGHVARELKSWSSKDDAEHIYLKSLLLAMADLHQVSTSCLGEQQLRDILLGLRTRAITPVTKTENGQRDRQVATMVDNTLS